MKRSAILSLLVVGGLLSADPASAGRICKDGFVVSTGSRADKDRGNAEASAWRSWRAADGQPLEGPKPIGRAQAKPQMQCLQDGDDQYWRCHVRAERCTPA